MDSAQTVLGKLMEDMIGQILALEKRVKELERLNDLADLFKRVERLEQLNGKKK